MATITFNREMLIDISGYYPEWTNHQAGPTSNTPLFSPPYKSVFIFIQTSTYACIQAWGILAVAAENRHFYAFRCLYEQSFHWCGDL
jgi:hypothetical protein